MLIRACLEAATKIDMPEFLGNMYPLLLTNVRLIDMLHRVM